MKQKTVDKLEDKVAEAIAKVVATWGLKRLPHVPSRRTMHLMAKAAVAVYEASAPDAEPHADSE